MRKTKEFTIAAKKGDDYSNTKREVMNLLHTINLAGGQLVSIRVTFTQKKVQAPIRAPRAVRSRSGGRPAQAAEAAGVETGRTVERADTGR